MRAESELVCVNVLFFVRPSRKAGKAVGVASLVNFLPGEWVKFVTVSLVFAVFFGDWRSGAVESPVYFLWRVLKALCQRILV